ncbi:hypothetical protein BKK50_09855, partial [Rodentibacter rarus]
GTSELDAKVAQATDLVEKAEAAEKAAEKALEDANADGVITPEEKAAIEKANENVAETKKAADDAVKALPDTVAEKEGLQTRVDDVNPVKVPEVTDANGNGKDDAQELADATKLVEDAEKASQEYNDALTEAQKDNAISQEEADKLASLKDTADQAKDAADKAVDTLPEGIEGKDGLETRVDAITNPDVPAVNDKDGNGIDDETDKLIVEIEDLVVKAEEAYSVMEDKYDEALENADVNTGKYKAADKKAFDTALSNAQGEKATAQEKVDEALASLPENVAKDFQKRLDALEDKELVDPSTEEDDEVSPYPDSIITGRTLNGKLTGKNAENVLKKIKDKNPLMDDKAEITLQKITTGDANDTVIVGTNRHYSSATDLKTFPRFYSLRDSEIETGKGDDVVVIAGDMNQASSVSNRTEAERRPGSKVITGEGNDIVKVSSSVRNGSVIDTGDGDDQVAVGQNFTGGSKLLLGEGDNTLFVGGKLRFGIDITAGSGNDKVTINRGIDIPTAKTEANKVLIDLGDGNNELFIGAKSRALVNALEVLTGSGEDVITLNGNLNNVVIQTGDGNDTVDLQTSYLYGSYAGQKLIETGAGDDVIKLGRTANLANGNKLSVDAGEGDDTVEFYFNYDATANQNQGLIKGGEGTDTLVLKQGGVTVNLATQGSGASEEGIQGFERIDMTSADAQTVKLTVADVLRNNDGEALFISGNSADTVDLGADGESSLGGFVKNAADTISGDSAPVAGHTYTAYSDSNGVKVYIDDAITNII